MIGEKILVIFVENEMHILLEINIELISFWRVGIKSFLLHSACFYNSLSVFLEIVVYAFN